MLNSCQHNTPASNTDIDEQLLTIYDATPVPMVLSRTDGSFEYANPALRLMLGYSEAEIYSPNIIISHPDETEVNQQIRATLQNDPFSPLRIEKRYLHKSGRVIPGYLTIVAEPDSAGNVKRFISQIVDQTEQKKNNDQLLLSSLVYKNSSEGMMVSDANNRILDINPAFTEITGYSLPELQGKNPRYLSSGRHSATFYSKMWNTIELSGCWSGEIWNKRKNGEIYAEWLVINTIYNEDGSVYRRVALFSDISKKKEAEALILQQANYDLLTELPNRRLFLESLKLESRKTKDSGLSGALLFINLDHFKEVNDALGHDQGDILLKEIAKRLTRTIRDSDLAARLSGDEFAIILSAIGSPRKVEKIANSILSAIEKPVQLADEQAFVTGSIGITLFPDDGVKPSQLLQNADQAMYAAKKAGQNRYHYFTPAMQEQALTRSNTLRDLRYAIERHQFELYYQPIVDLKTGKIIKLEALIRWHHPIKGLTAPDQFIPLAEDTGMILRIGEWVFHTAAKQLQAWRKLGFSDLELSINVSPLQLRNDGIQADDWALQLDKMAIPKDAMVIEITENLLMDHNQRARSVLENLHQDRFKIAIDDFGTGYSSLAYLQDFSADFLKIDQTFIRNLTSTSNDTALCEAIIVMAHKLGIKVIAEGIETEEQQNILINAGCDYGQGWLFAKALPADELTKLLRQQVAVSCYGANI